MIRTYYVKKLFSSIYISPTMKKQLCLSWTVVQVGIWIFNIATGRSDDQESLTSSGLQEKNPQLLSQAIRSLREHILLTGLTSSVHDTLGANSVSLSQASGLSTWSPGPCLSFCWPHHCNAVSSLPSSPSPLLLLLTRSHLDWHPHNYGWLRVV